MNTTKNMFRVLLMTTPVLLLVATSGQAATTDAACATATHNAEIDSSNGTYSSPASYGSASCNYAQIIDVLPLSVQNPTRPAAGVYQTWAGPTPTNPTDCQKATIVATEYVMGSQGWTRNATRTAKGVWNTGPAFTGCTIPSVSWWSSDGSVVQGQSYRFAVQAYFDNGGGGPIQQFVMTTRNGVPLIQ
jgi:hypothetical protein